MASSIREPDVLIEILSALLREQDVMLVVLMSETTENSFLAGPKILYSFWAWLIRSGPVWQERAVRIRAPSCTGVPSADLSWEVLVLASEHRLITLNLACLHQSGWAHCPGPILAPWSRCCLGLRCDLSRSGDADLSHEGFFSRLFTSLGPVIRLSAEACHGVLGECPLELVQKVYHDQVPKLVFYEMLQVKVMQLVCPFGLQRRTKDQR